MARWSDDAREPHGAARTAVRRGERQRAHVVVLSRAPAAELTRGPYRKANRESGQMRTNALPMMLERGMVPQYRLSHESDSLSPIMK